MCVLALLHRVDYEHGWLNFAVHSSNYSMLWFPLDLRVTTLEQCPCLAVSVRMTEAKKNPSKAKITSNLVHTSCTQLVIISSVRSARKQCPPNSDHSSNITSHRPPVKAQLKWVKGETSKWNLRWLSEHHQTTAFCSKLVTLTLQNTSWGISSSFIQKPQHRQCGLLPNEKWSHLVKYL